MKYLGLGFAISCALLSFFSMQGMELNKEIIDKMEVITIDEKPETIYYLINSDEILNYLCKNMGIDLNIIHVHLNDLHVDKKKFLALTIKNLLPLIGTVFDEQAAQLPRKSQSKKLSEIIKDINFSQHEISKEHVSTYNDSLKDLPENSWTILELNSPQIHKNILETISKIIMTTLAYNKPLVGILFAQEKGKNQIAIIPAPQQRSTIFGQGFTLGLILSSPREFNKGDRMLSNTGITIPDKMDAGLQLAVDLITDLDKGLTDLENNPNLSKKQKKWVSRIRGPLLIGAGALGIILFSWQLFVQVNGIIPHNCTC